MLDIVQKLTVVDDWLELRTVTQRIQWIHQLTNLMGGETIEFYN